MGCSFFDEVLTLGYMDKMLTTTLTTEHNIAASSPLDGPVC
jgi:hypothetical protein